MQSDLDRIFHFERKPTEKQICPKHFSVGQERNAAAFPDRNLKFWLQGQFFMLKKMKIGAHLKILKKCPKMVRFGQNFGSNAYKSQTHILIATKLWISKVWQITSVQLKFRQNRTCRTGDIARKKSYVFLESCFFA